LRHFPTAKSFPVGGVGARGDLLLHLVQDGGARGVVLGHGTLPFAIYLGRGLCGGGGSEGIGGLCTSDRCAHEEESKTISKEVFICEAL
jgi:hypothetical protein